MTAPAPALTLQLIRRREVADGIASFDFAAPDGAQLPAYAPGAHIVINMVSGETGRVHANAYTLTSDPADLSHYRITVMRQPAGRGGSILLHDVAREGDLFDIGRPANFFALDRTARHSVLIAGGIGITPFLTMMRDMAARGQSFELHYGFRSRAQAAFLDRLSREFGARITLYPADEGHAIPLHDLLGGRPMGTHLYTCGPAGLMDAVVEMAATLGWPPSAVHLERFSVAAAGEPFMVELAGSGQRIEVGSSQSLLEALEQAGLPVPSLCRMGACGHCETRVTQCEGEMLHRDRVLSHDEREAHAAIIPCVSRFTGGKLVLDL